MDKQTYIRFYIFWKTEHQKLFNPNKILCLAFSTLLGHYIFKSMLVYFSIGSKGLFEKCIGLENGSNYLFIVISTIYNVLIIIVGVIADLTMYQNLKRHSIYIGTVRSVVIFSELTFRHFKQSNMLHTLDL